MVKQDIKSMKENMHLLRKPFWKAMRVRWYDAERIAQYGRSRATLDATERHDWGIIHPVSPQQTPWSSILA
jgi:hypothetical protein